MTDNQTITLSELDDEPGKVYLFGVAGDAPEAVREWMATNFIERWNSTFDHARIMTVPMNVEANVIAEIESSDDLRDLIERHNSTTLEVKDEYQE